MLRIEGLSAGYDGTDVVHGVDLHVDEGEVVAIIGPNGAGKSTLLRAVCGLVEASGGSVLLDGDPVLGRRTHRLSRDGVAFVPAERHLFPGMTVQEHLELGAFPGRPSTDRLALVHELFPRLGERPAQRARTMSGGEQQMLAVARALMGEPRLLLLDEPTTGLAPTLARDAYEALGALRDRGTTILVAEQQVALSLGLADRGHVLVDGRVRLTGTAEELAADDEVRRAYLGAG